MRSHGPDLGPRRRTPAWWYRGGAYLRAGDPARAVADYTEALRLGPRAALYRSRAAAYRALGDDVRAALDERLADERTS